MAVVNTEKKSLLLIISVSTLMIVSLVFVLNGIYFYKLQKDQLVAEIKGQAQESSGRLSKIIAPYVDSYQINEYEKLVMTEVKTPNHYALAGIVVNDYKMAEILGEQSYLSGMIRLDSDEVREYKASDTEYLSNAYYSSVEKIMSSGGEQIGLLTVYVNDQTLKKHIKVLFTNTTLITVAFLFILLFSLYLILRNHLIKPLNELSNAISNRDDAGIPKSEIPSSGYHEFSFLALAMNDMLKAISIARNRIVDEHHLLENVIMGTRVGTWFWNVQTGQTRFNERWAEIVGYSLKELEPVSIDTWMELLHPEDAEKSGQLLEQYFQGETDFYECEARMRHKNGSWIWILDRGKVLKWSESGEPLEMYGTHQDITRRKTNELQLALAASVYQQVHEGILITNVEGRIVDVNDAFTRITGYTKDEVVGQSPRLLKSGRHDSNFYNLLWAELEREGVWTGEIWNKRKNGEIYPELITISAVKDGSGNRQHYVGLFADITSLKEHEHQLEKIAHFDTLTGLPNRFLFNDRLRVAMHRAKRHQIQLALLFIDLDGFKEVNDTFGHDVGDRLLVKLSNRVNELLREEDTFARLGGDEFTIVLPGITAEIDLKNVLDRILTSIAQPINVNDITLHVSGSIGVALYPDQDDVDADQLIRHADQAMYTAKLSGKNGYQFFDPDYDRSVRGLHQEVNRVKEALVSNEFELYYQPKVNLRTSEIIGFEALLRWQHPDKGLLSPGVFLPSIEDHVVMVEIGEWTIRKSLMQLSNWCAEGINLPVSVNIAAIHLQQTDFFERLQSLLTEFHDVSPQYLQFEVLESSALENMVTAQTIINQCRDIGIQFAIDDFGTGYSSISYLKDIPAQILKIDQSFVKNITNETDDRMILGGIVGLAKAFSKDVIAEGLEDMQYAELLMDVGCDMAQGYGIAYPMPAIQIPDWITQWNNLTIDNLSID